MKKVDFILELGTNGETEYAYLFHGVMDENYIYTRYNETGEFLKIKKTDAREESSETFCSINDVATYFMESEIGLDDTRLIYKSDFSKEIMDAIEIAEEDFNKLVIGIFAK